MPPDAPTIHTQPGNIPSAEGDYPIWQSLSQQQTARAAYTTNNTDREKSDITTDPSLWESTSIPHTQAGPFYPPQTPSYPDFSAEGSNTPFPQGDLSSPDQTTLPTTHYPESPQLATPHSTSRKTLVALTLAIIAFMLAAALTIALLFVRPGTLQHILGGNAATPTIPLPSPTVASRTPEQQARTIVEQYYSDINNKDYRAAYNLWEPPPSNYNNFANGFAHTKHDYIQLGTITQQSDGTVQVPIIITALNDTDIKETFSGYYIVGQQPDNSWKITGAKIHPGVGS